MTNEEQKRLAVLAKRVEEYNTVLCLSAKELDEYRELLKKKLEKETR